MRVLSGVFALALVAPIGLWGPDSVAAPKKKAAGGTSPPACGAKILPLVEGNTWTYVPIASPFPIARELEKLAPPQPKQIVITVVSVAPKGRDTLATLEEKITYETETQNKKNPKVLSEVIVKSTIQCNKNKFDISPDSFFFAAEPGGYRALTFDKYDRAKAPNDTSWRLTNGTIGENQWGEDIVAHFTRHPAKTSNAKLSGGKLELERRFTPLEPETVVTKEGLNYRAEKLAVVTTGRVTFDEPLSPTPAPSELPKGWINTLWMVNNVGVVQTLNMYAHMYQLSDVQLK